MPTLQEFIKKAAATAESGLGAVLHVGAGSCAELDAYLRLNAEKILLVEANPQLAGQLLEKTRASKHVQVVSSAVAAAEDPNATLRILNNPRESTLLQPMRLLELLPNLDIVGEISVPAVPLTRMIKRLAPDPARRNLLVLEIQGAEFPVLSATPAKVLQNFSWIAVRATVEALHEGGAGAKDVDTLLRQCGFRAMTSLPMHPAPPIVNLFYEIDMIRIQQELAHEMAKRAEGAARRNQELADARAEAEARRNQELAGELAKRAEGAARRNQELAGELAKRTEAEARLGQELAEARNTASLSTKLQILREADLKDLQDRYRQSLSIQESQHQMLVKVGERLKAAASYFYQMADDGAAPPSEIKRVPGSAPKRTIRPGAAGKLTDKGKGKGKGGA